jgi:hypothetical protein
MESKRVNPSLGGTIRKHFKEWLRNQKWPNHFIEPFIYMFSQLYIYIHIYPLHASIYGLKFILELKVEIVKILYS